MCYQFYISKMLETFEWCSNYFYFHIYYFAQLLWDNNDWTQKNVKSTQASPPLSMN